VHLVTKRYDPGMRTSRQVDIMVLLLLLTVLAMGLYWAWDSVRAERAEERQAETAAERGSSSRRTAASYGRTGKG
jgi:nitrate reductase gamma subunit